MNTLIGLKIFQLYNAIIRVGFFMKTSNIFKLSTSLAAIGLLTSCGGGGGGSDTTTSKPTEPETVKLQNIGTFAEAGDKVIIDGNTVYNSDLSYISNAKVSGTYEDHYGRDVAPNLANKDGWPVGVGGITKTISSYGRTDAEYIIVVGRSENSFSLVGQGTDGYSLSSRDPFYLSSGIEPNQMPQAGRRTYTGQGYLTLFESKESGNSEAYSFDRVLIEGNGNSKLIADFDRDEAAIYFGQFAFDRTDIKGGSDMIRTEKDSKFTRNIDQTYNLGAISGNKIKGTENWETPSLLNEGDTLKTSVKSSGGIYGQNADEASVAFRGKKTDFDYDDGTRTYTERSVWGSFASKK